MVDFNNDTTIATPVADIIKVLIVQRRNDFLEASEHYFKGFFAGSNPDTNIMKARLYSLYLEIKAMLDRHFSNGEINELVADIKSDEANKLIDAYITMNKLLDDVKLTRVDTKKSYDSTRVEEENTEKLK